MSTTLDVGNGSLYKVDPAGGASYVPIAYQLGGTLNISRDIPESTNKDSNQNKEFVYGNLGWNGTVTGRLGTDPAVDLDGATEYFHVADDANLDFTTDMTIEVVFTPDKITGTQILAHKDDTSDGYILQLNGDELEMVINNSGSTDATVTTTNANLLVGKQYVVRAVFDGGTTNVNIYLRRAGSDTQNNLTTGTVGTIPAAIGVNATRLTIGTDDTASGNFFDGKIYTVGLAALGLFVDNDRRLTANLSEAYYLFDGDATDSSSNGLDLTAVNIAASDYGDLTFFTLKDSIQNATKLTLQFLEAGTVDTYTGTVLVSEITRDYPQNDIQGYTVNLMGDGAITKA